MHCESFKRMGTPATARHQAPQVLVAWVVYLGKHCKIPLPQNVSPCWQCLCPPNSQKVRFSRPLCKRGSTLTFRPAQSPESTPNPVGKRMLEASEAHTLVVGSLFPMDIGASLKLQVAMDTDLQLVMYT